MRLDKCEYPSRKSSSEPLHITVNIDNLNAGYWAKARKAKKRGGGGIELTLAKPKIIWVLDEINIVKVI